jgi:hypothetical protein
MSACRIWPGQTRHLAQTVDHELRKVPVSDPAEIARLQASTPAGTAPGWPAPPGGGQAGEEDPL